MTLSKANALRLANRAMEDGALVWRGSLAQGEDGQFSIGGRNFSEWLSQHAGQEVIVVLGRIDASAQTQLRQCSRCGRDYEGIECPHCSQARARLRGREQPLD
jgi:hypothetical protein